MFCHVGEIPRFPVRVFNVSLCFWFNTEEMSQSSPLTPGDRSPSVKGSSPVSGIILSPTPEPPNEDSEATERKSTPPTARRESTPGISYLCSYFVQQ